MTQLQIAKRALEKIAEYHEHGFESSTAKKALAEMGDGDDLKRVREWCEAQYRSLRYGPTNDDVQRAKAFGSVIAFIDALKSEAKK